MKRSVLKFALTAGLGCFAMLQAGAQEVEGCSAASLIGSYGYQISGSIPGTVAIAGIARVVFDGHGNLIQIGSSQINVVNHPPVVSLDQTATGTYTVNPDCTGTETLEIGGVLHHSRFVLVDHGRRVLDTSVDPGVVLNGIGEKQ